MSAEKKHDYHLVDPSPWPIYVSFSCLVLAIGTIFYMHNDVSWGMYLD
jgi:cytochrome c oxidase subunit 3